MEASQNQVVTSEIGRPANAQERATQLAERARDVRRELMAGKGEFEICRALSLTRREYATAKRWIARKWVDNDSSYADFLITEYGRIEVLQRQIDAVEQQAELSSYDRARIVFNLVKAQHDIEFNIREMGLRLGMLQREKIQITENRTIRVSFGDEGVMPWFSSPKVSSPAVIDVAAPTPALAPGD